MKKFCDIVNNVYSNMLFEWYELDKIDNKTEEDIKKENELSNEIVAYRNNISEWFKKYIKYDGHGLFVPNEFPPVVYLNIFSKDNSEIVFSLYILYKGEKYTVNLEKSKHEIEIYRYNINLENMLFYIINDMINKIINAINEKININFTYLFYDIINDMKSYICISNRDLNDFIYFSDNDFKKITINFENKVNKYIDSHYKYEHI